MADMPSCHNWFLILLSPQLHPQRSTGAPRCRLAPTTWPSATRWASTRWKTTSRTTGEPRCWGPPGSRGQGGFVLPTSVGSWTGQGTGGALGGGLVT